MSAEYAMDLAKLAADYKLHLIIMLNPRLLYFATVLLLDVASNSAIVLVIM